MELSAAGLKEQPFRTHGRPIVLVHYEGQERATTFLRDTCSHNTGLALLQGPSLSGKTTIIRHFARARKAQGGAAAVVTGATKNTATLLESILREFGYEYQFDSVGELLGMLKVFIRQQTAKKVAPILIVENSHEMNPSAVAVLCELAEVRVREKFALKLVLVSDRAIKYILRGESMESMSKRLTGDLHLEPMTIDETSDYLYAKLRHGGCNEPEKLMPETVCEEIYRAAGGWPGMVDRIGLLALATASQAPVEPSHIEHPVIPKKTGTAVGSVSTSARDATRPKYPVIYLTHDAKTLNKIKFQGTRLLIGRSQHNDITIDSKFVSRHHALLVRNGKSTLLMDLNSANGTYVNSWRVSNQVLLDNDIITIGEHGLKFVHAIARDRAALEADSFNDTVVMQSMADMRRVLAREHTEVVPRADNSAQTDVDADSA